MTDVAFRVYDPTNTTFLGALTRAHSKRFVTALSAAGFGSCLIDIDDSQAALAQHRRVVRVQIDGVDRFAYIIDDLPRDESGAGGTEPATMEVRGPGLSAWLGSQRGGALVWPARYRTRQTTRNFGWYGLDYNLPGTDGWIFPGGANTFGRQENPTPILPRLVGQPPEWPDRLSQWMTTQVPTVGPGGEVVHEGTNQMLLARHLPSTGAEHPMRIWVAGTNEWDLYFDGERIASGGGFRDVVDVDVFLEGRPHALALDVRQERTPGFKYDVLAAMLTSRRVNPDGSLGSVLFRTYTPTLQRVPHPVQKWRMLANPTEIPGLTVGRILTRLLSEAKARGAIPSLTWGTWGAVTDANGQAWLEQVTHGFELTTKLSDVLDQLVGLGGVEYVTTPDGRLDVANRIGVARAGSFGSLADAKTSGEGIRATVLLGQAANGYVERTSSAGVTQYGRIEDAVSFGDQPSRIGIAPSVDRMLDATARPRDEFDLELSDGSPVPFVDFQVGDTFSIGRVQQITMVQDDEAGAVSWALSISPEG